MDSKHTDRSLRSRSKRLIPPALALLAWVSVLSWWTSGFSAFTTYSHTLKAAGPLPRAVPSFRVRDQFGDLHDTAEFSGRYLLLQFVYLSCSDVCPLAMADFHRIHAALRGRVPGELVMLTVSIDPTWDTTERLFDTWRLDGRPAGWYMAALASPLDDAVQADLRRLGVWVSRRGPKDFNHSAWSFLIDPEGCVVEVLDTPGRSGRMIAAIDKRLP